MHLNQHQKETIVIISSMVFIILLLSGLCILNFDLSSAFAVWIHSPQDLQLPVSGLTFVQSLAMISTTIEIFGIFYFYSKFIEKRID